MSALVLISKIDVYCIMFILFLYPQNSAYIILVNQNYSQ